ncbi:hypothetical protein F4780DRAFT_732168 [Xylariomycetidae sp. FL0641]|nr:hypothetical protein F4780DRAFT_732168 [Xylariomycetidae sp. FL0641]
MTVSSPKPNHHRSILLRGSLVLQLLSPVHSPCYLLVSLDSEGSRRRQHGTPPVLLCGAIWRHVVFVRHGSVAF